MEIEIPEGKKPKMTESKNKCVIEWVPAEKTFDEYVEEYTKYTWNSFGCNLSQRLYALAQRV